MLAFINRLVVASLFLVLVKCEIPNLNVRRMDKSLIAKKRQDTLDMCRIFTEENAKIEHMQPKIIPSYNFIRKSHNRRHKRDVAMTYDINPALNAEDAKRVEKIVDKLYDDMEEKGEKVTYRQNSIPTTTTTKQDAEKASTSPNIDSKSPKRRFFFAPELIVSAPPIEHPTPATDIPIYIQARWKHGIVPYFIDSKTYDAQLQEIIINAFDYVEKATCIRLQKLRERPTDKESLQNVDWVYITNPSGVRQCVHSNEKRKINGVQMSVLGYDCMSIGDIVHEVMHILGFPHEHTRSDRDQHISILWDNIKPGYRKYFEIAKPGDQYILENLPYDYRSILHYPPRAFSKNGQITILAEPGLKVGQREGLSEIDVEKVGTIYSGECVERNREYLLKTCPSVVKPKTFTSNATQRDIEEYFKDRLWPFGIFNYKLRDKMEFSTEERENIKAVIRHIEKETCIVFRDIAEDENKEGNPGDQNDDSLTSTPAETTLPTETSPNDKTPPSANTPPTKTPTEDKTDDNYYDGGFEFTDSDLDAYTSKPVKNKNLKPKVPEIIITDNGEQEKMADKKLSKSLSDNEIKKVDEHDTDLKMLERRNNLMKVSAEKSKSVRKHSLKPSNSTKKASRRHAASIVVLTRSATPGCKCPKPGKPDGRKVLEINGDCFNSVNDLLHLFVHYLGLDHQHNTYDRDSYLHINWKNLTPDIEKELKEKLPPAASVGFPYDYQSVMHYPWLQIKDGITNMMYPIWNDGWAMGHWQGLSSFDVQKLSLLYFGQCAERQKHKSRKDSNSIQEENK